MSEEKRIEQEIGWYKVAFAILIATGISLLAWFAQNYTLAEPILLIFGLIGIFIISIAIYLINKQVFKCLDKLRSYKMGEYLFITAFVVFFGGLALTIFQGLNHKFPSHKPHLTKHHS